MKKYYLLLIIVTLISHSVRIFAEPAERDPIAGFLSQPELQQQVNFMIGAATTQGTGGGDCSVLTDFKR